MGGWEDGGGKSDQEVTDWLIARGLHEARSRTDYRPGPPGGRRPDPLAAGERRDCRGPFHAARRPVLAATAKRGQTAKCAVDRHRGWLRRGPAWEAQEGDRESQ